MRTRFAGPTSSSYKEKDHKVTKSIEPAIQGISYIKIQNKDITNNPTGTDVKKN